MLLRLNTDPRGRFKEYKELFGSPVDIVRQMRESDLFGRYDGLPDYVMACAADLERLWEVSLFGDTRLRPRASDGDEVVAAKFVAALIKHPTLAALVINSQTWDSHTAKVVRLALGLPQTEFSRLIDIDPQTVSRWERGLHQPTSRVVFSAVRSAARAQKLAVKER